MSRLNQNARFEFEILPKPVKSGSDQENEKKIQKKMISPICYFSVVIPQFEFKLPPPKQTQEELFGSFVVHCW
jgi:hypothetical protein